MTKLIAKLKSDIKRFNDTGRLPREEMKVDRKRWEQEGLDQDYLAVPEPSPAAVKLYDEWGQALKKMPPLNQKVYSLHMVGGMSQEETAAILNVSQQVVSYTVKQIRKEAKKIMTIL